MGPIKFSFQHLQTIMKKFCLREMAGSQHQTYALGVKEVCFNVIVLSISLLVALSSCNISNIVA